MGRPLRYDLKFLLNLLQKNIKWSYSHDNGLFSRSFRLRRLKSIVQKASHFILPIKFKNMVPWFKIFVNNIRFDSIAIILNRVFSNDDRNEAIIDRWAMWINRLSSQWNQIQPWHRNCMWNPTSQPFIDLLEINGYLRFRLSFSLQCFGHFCWSSWPKQIWRSKANGKRYFLYL